MDIKDIKIAEKYRLRILEYKSCLEKPEVVKLELGIYVGYTNDFEKEYIRKSLSIAKSIAELIVRKAMEEAIQHLKDKLVGLGISVE